ncbi:hypothetical protein [Tyzzerella sp. An114]|nr:hypothetical protein [Tyzzerella sp. An114]
MDIKNCKIRNEFIEKAIEFYSGYTSTEVHSEFLFDKKLCTKNIHSL